MKSPLYPLGIRSRDKDCDFEVDIWGKVIGIS